MGSLVAANEADVARRVDSWSQRLDRWDAEAEKATQNAGLKQRRVTVAEEKKLVEAMRPDRQLVRPLLVVVPEMGAQQ